MVQRDTNEAWNKLPVCDVKVRERIKFQEFAPFLELKSRFCLLNYVQTVSSYIVEEQEMTWSVVPWITYAICQVSHQEHKWFTVISFHKQRLNKSFRVIDNSMVLSIFWPTWALNLSLEWLFKKVTKLTKLFFTKVLFQS